MTRPRMAQGGVLLALLIALFGIFQWYRNASAPPPVRITQFPEPAPAAAAMPGKILGTRGAAPKGPGTASLAAATTPSASSPPAAANSGAVVVHVVGAVKKPGVYRLPAKARLLDALHAAGGPKAGADLEAINLASFAQDAEQIRVPALSERRAPAASAASPPAAARSPAAIPSRPVRSLARYPLAEPSSAATESRASPAAGSHASAGHGSGPAGPQKMSGIVNLNTATEDELRTLPGVGAKTAETILAYRQEHGPFQRVEDLLEIRGIGEKKLARLREWITVK